MTALGRWLPMAHSSETTVQGTLVRAWCAMRGRTRIAAILDRVVSRERAA